MITTAEVRVGSAFMHDGQPLIVQKKYGQKSGRTGCVTQLRVKNILTGTTMDLGLDAGEKFEEVFLEEKTMRLSYIDGEDYVFMDQETFEQIHLTKEDLGDNAGYISPEDDIDIKITFYNDESVGINPPTNVVRTITYCEPGVRGNTTGKTFKPATLDTGIEVNVPLFIEEGEKILIDTRDGTFVERAK